MLTSAKLRGSWYQKVYFLKLNMCVYLRTKFQASNIIVTSFRKGGGGGGGNQNKHAALVLLSLDNTFS